MVRRFTEDELNSIIEDYNNGMTLNDLGDKYSRNPSSIIHKLSDMGIYKKTKYYYTDDDIDFLREHYPVGDFDAIFDRFPKLTKAGLMSMCHKYGISADYYNDKKWTEEDLDIVKNYYYTNTLDEIKAMIDNRHTCDAIQTKAFKYLGYSKDRTWTEDELNILYTYYPIEDVDSVVKRLPNRTRDAVIRQANNLHILGLRANETWWTYEQIKYLVDNWRFKTDEAIGNSIGKDADSVKNKRWCLGFSRVKHFNEASYADIKKFLRGHLSEWKTKSMESCGYQCVLTGSKDFVIHHLYSFSSIVNDVFDENDFAIKDYFSDYTIDELTEISDACLREHYKYPLGICIRSDIHDEFHKKYGSVVTPDMWYEFVDDYKI